MLHHDGRQGNHRQGRQKQQGDKPFQTMPRIHTDEPGGGQTQEVNANPESVETCKECHVKGAPVIPYRILGEQKQRVRMLASMLPARREADETIRRP